MHAGWKINACKRVDCFVNTMSLVSSISKNIVYLVLFAVNSEMKFIMLLVILKRIKYQKGNTSHVIDNN